MPASPLGDSRPPGSRADRVRALIVPALLIAVATVGVYRHHSVQQTPWQGASFGMFSTHDGRPSRTVVVEIRGSGESQRIRIPEPLIDEADVLEVAPTDRAASDLATQIRDAIDVPHGKTVVVEVRRLELETDDRFVVTLDTIARGSADT